MALSSTRSSRKPATAPGERIYAIGDVHGCYELLLNLLDRVEAHSASLPPAASMHVVVLGDLVDRGPDSREVVRFLYDLQRQDDRLIVLLGNHEEMMLKAIDGDTRILRGWLRTGGVDTLRSFGIEVPDRDDDARDFGMRATAAIPRAWLQWLRRLPLSARSGDYLFCHAGVRPGVPLKRQSRTDLLWIRDDFLDDPADHGAMIVHGHSVETTVEMRPNRIGIDTGAYRTGVLTALYLEGDKREIISTSSVLATAGAA